jgi:hypothetical protein
MGILDKALERLAKEIVKAAPTVTPIADWQMMDPQSGTGQAVPLTRDPNLGSVAFGPGSPLIPGAINTLRPDGRPDPRRNEYQVAQNLNVTESRLIPFQVLRASGEQIDIIRRCIETTKQKLIGLDWDIVLANDAVENIAADEGVDNIRAMAMAKEKFNPEIARARQFWNMPDVSNGLIFADWLNMALEEILVLDAWAVWPEKTVGGDLIGLQILDGSTIKPLIDGRGMRPKAPFPAFQQILYGFPRSEFNAANDMEDADGVFSSDEISYLVRNRRTTTVYGYSPVERALPLADIYLRRQQWLRAEYTEGVLPDLMFKTDANFGNNADLLRAYENVFNDDLGGQSGQRKKARILPAGLEPVQFEGYGERFKDVLDEYLVTSICGHFGIGPSEIGFSAKGGLGGSGIQEGQAESSEVVGLLPLGQWVSKMLTQLSHNYLGMPRELEFRFAPSGRKDSGLEAAMLDQNLRGARMTVNETRNVLGLPLIDSPDADRLLFVTGGTTYRLDEEGWNVIDGTQLDPITGEETPAQPITPNAPETPVTPPETPDSAANTGADGEEDLAEKEVKAFLRWLKKSPDRTFNFEHLEWTYADALNKYVAAKDYDQARWFAERYFG